MFIPISEAKAKLSELVRDAADEDVLLMARAALHRHIGDSAVGDRP